MKRHTAEKYMTTDLITGDLEETAEQYFEKLRSLRGPRKNIPYVYVTRKDGTLCGVISYDDLFRNPVHVKLGDICTKEIIHVYPETDQEHVAILAIQKQLRAVPVVDHEKKFLGVVSSFEILHILHLEHIEDFLRAAGIRHHKGSFLDVLQAKPFDVLKARVPSLVIGLLGGVLATFLVSFFQNALQQELILVFFMPVIVYMSAAVGVQTETLFIRSLTLGLLKIKKYMLREALIGPVIGVLFGSFIFLFSYAFWRKLELSFVIGFSMAITIVFAVFIAVLIPWIELKMKKDPAIASGPFATIIQDIMSLAVYFTIATLLL